MKVVRPSGLAIFIVPTQGARTRSFAEKKWFGAVSEAKASTVGIFFCKRTEEALADAQLPEPSISTMMKVMVFLFCYNRVMTKLIILRGYPGSGKTTIGRRLAEKGAGKFIDHNSILTFIADIAGNDEGIYKDIANLELAIARKLLKERTSVIVARGFSNLESIRAYEDVAIECGAEPIIIRLEVDRATLSKRVGNSERLNDFNPTVTDRALGEWIDSNPIINHPSEKIVDNTQSLETAIDAIVEVA